jgi:glycerol-3-phosphate dehydrogenase (NAD(P)+)
MNNTVSVFGAGAFGTALAQTFANKGLRCHLWARNPEIALMINAEHKNPQYSGALILDSKIHASSDFAQVAQKSSTWVYGCSSHFFRQFCKDIRSLTSHTTTLIDTSKGLEPETLLMHSEIVHEVLGGDFARQNFLILSGPSFAKELLENIPTSVSLAGYEKNRAEQIQTLLGAKNFRLYVSGDPIGCQIGGAAKNVIAIALGIAEGLGLGQNSRAALLNRGLIEIARLGEKLGAKPQSFLGLSCLGDLLLTCTSLLSRNFRFGTLLGQGLSPTAAQKTVNSTIEGAQSASAIYELSQRHEVELPICREVYQVLHQGKPAREAYEDLLNRPQGMEWF